MRTVAISVVLFAAHCGGSSGPQPNSGIATSATTVGPTATQVTCTGPADELAMLGSLCDFSAETGTQNTVRWSWQEPDMAVALGDSSGAYLLLYAAVPCCNGNDNEASAAHMSAFVDLHPGSQPIDDWHTAEAVTSGSTSVTTAAPSPCGGQFSGSATLQWRATTIQATWVAAAPGC
jgi:hypothetical protein